MKENNCCENCRREKDRDYWFDENIPLFDCIDASCKCHSPASEMGWEERFKKIENKWYQDGQPKNYLKSEQVKDIQDFIRETLQSERSSMVERVRKLKLENPKYDDRKEFWNDACDEIIEIIESA